MTFDLRTYLDRIGLADCPATLDGLHALQAAQMRRIAFECIDPFLGIVPDLSPAALWDKLVADRRGGYCFELNSLLGQAMEALGFEARPVMARVRSPAMPEGGARSHLAWIVSLDGEEWLVDAGFGGPCPPLPVPMRPGIEREAGRSAFRIAKVADEEILERRGGGEWVRLYGFDRAHVTPLDIEAANFVTAKWNEAPFPNNLIVAIQAEEGRLSLLNRTLRIDTGETSRSENIESPDALAEILEQRFLLDIPAEMTARIWRRLEEAEQPAATPHQ